MRSQAAAVLAGTAAVPYKLGFFHVYRESGFQYFGGYVLAGNTDANSDEAGWVIKTDGNGNVVWMNTYGSDNSHYALVDDIKITNDGASTTLFNFDGGDKDTISYFNKKLNCDVRTENG